MNKAILTATMILLLVMAACQPAPQVVATEAPDTGVVALAPTASEEPPLPLVFFIPATNANCRIGPAIAYPYLAILVPGAEYQVLGINEDASWLFINTDLTQCWVKLTTGQANGDLGQMPLVAYGPVPTPIQQVAGAGGEGGTAGDGGSTGGGTVITLMPISPIIAIVMLCGSYSTEADCTSHGCTWVPPKLVMCGTPPTQVVCGTTAAYCSN